VIEHRHVIFVLAVFKVAKRDVTAVSLVSSMSFLRAKAIQAMQNERCFETQ